MVVEREDYISTYSGICSQRISGYECKRGSESYRRYAADIGSNGKSRGNMVQE